MNDASSPTAVKVPAAILMTGSAGQSMLYGVVGPGLPALALLFRDRAETIISLIMALPSLGLVIAGFIAGPVVEKLGPRMAIIASVIIYALSGSLPAYIAEPNLILASRLLLGLACGIMTTAATVLLVASHEGEARGRLIGYQTSVGSILGLVTLLVAGVLVAHFGWQSAYLLYGLCLLPMLVLALVAVPDLRPAAEADPAAFLPTVALLWPVYLLACLLFVIPVACGAQVVFLLTDVGTRDPFLQSVIMALMTVGSTVSGALFGRIYAKFGSRMSLILSLVAGAAGLVMIGLATGPIVMGLGSLFAGLSIGIFISFLWLTTARIAPPHMRPRGLALLSTALFLGGFIYPVVFGALALPFGKAGAFVLMGGIMTIGAIVSIVVPRKVEVPA